MKLTFDNYISVLNDFDIRETELVFALLQDANEYSNNIFPKTLEIHINEHHTEYSAERTDPCPDYYSMFYIKWNNSNDIINDYFTLSELNEHMCTLCEAFEQLR